MFGWLSILDPLGRVLALYGAFMLVPVGAGLFADEPFFQFERGGLEPYWVTAACLLALGAVLHFSGRRHFAKMRARNAFLLVLLIWMLLPMAGAIPLLRYAGSFAHAYFEAASGMTASGATVLTEIDGMPVSLKLWRGLMSWIGGMGLIVLAVAILPMLGVGGRQLYKHEIPGPIKETDITPQITETAKGLWKIYVLLTLLCMLAYWLFGMTPLDAAVHSFTTMSLGGFSNHDSSYAFFNSPLIEAAAVVFMILAGMNFTTHFASFSALTSGKARGAPVPRGGGMQPLHRLRRFIAPYKSDIECRAYLGALALCVFAVSVCLYANDVYDSVAQSLRYGIFNAVSIATTTGYSNTNFGSWPLFAPFLMLFMANFTACGGSTGGGVKMMRAITLFKMTKIEQVKMLHDRAFMNIRIGQRVMPNMAVSSVLFFIIAYMFTIFVITMLFLLVESRAPQAFARALAAEATAMVEKAAAARLAGNGGANASAAVSRLGQKIDSTRDLLSEILEHDINRLLAGELRRALRERGPERIAAAVDRGLTAALAAHVPRNRKQQLEHAELTLAHEKIRTQLHAATTRLVAAAMDDLVAGKISGGGGIDLLTAFSAAMACVSNTGPGLGDVGPAGTYRSFSDTASWVGSFAMLLGRLELMLFLLLFRRELWR